VAEGFSIAQGFVDIVSRIDRSGNRRNAERAGDEAGESFVTRMGTKLISGIGGSVLPALGAVLNAGLAAAPAVAAAGAAIWQVSSAAIAAAPALLALGVAFKIVTASITALMPAIKKSLGPITDGLKEANEEASKLATQGVKPLAEEFVKLNMPGISMMMNNIARSTNGVIRGTLKWLNTTRGMQAITNITSSIGAAMLRLGPNVTSVVTSFVAMLGRISGVSLAAGESGLSGVLHKLEIVLDRITAESVQAGLDSLRTTFLAVKGAVETTAHWIGVALGVYRQYKTEIMLISDVLGVLAVVFGGPVTAIIALIGLVIRHFDTLRAAYQNLVSMFQTSTQGPAFLNNLKAAADVVIPALVSGFKLIWSVIGPTLDKIWKQITTQLIPAFGEFVAAAAPVVKFFIERLAPLVASAMNTVLKVISGVITIVTGIFKVFTGILKGDWSLVWEGIKQILRGAVSVLVSLVKGLVSAIKLGLSNLGAILKGIFTGAVNLAVSAFRQLPGKVATVAKSAKSAITGVFSSAGSWLVNAGARIISGLISGIRNKIGELKSTLGNVTNLIPDWKGPAKKDAELLTPAGKKIMDGLMKGIAVRKPALKAQLVAITRAISTAAALKAKAKLAASKGTISTAVMPGGKPVARAGETTGSTSDSATSGGLSIGQLVIQLQGILDPTDPASTRRMIAALFELLKAYEKSYV